MYCKKCGIKYDSDERFCAECGSKLVDEAKKEKTTTGKIKMCKNNHCFCRNRSNCGWKFFRL